MPLFIHDWVRVVMGMIEARETYRRWRVWRALLAGSRDDEGLYEGVEGDARSGRGEGRGGNNTGKCRGQWHLHIPVRPCSIL